jgi:tetratricopeptide (TPR) repeat protein
LYILNGKTDEAFQLVSDAESMLAPPMDKMIPFMYLNIYLKLEDVENSEKYLVGAEEAIEALQIEIIRHTIFEAKGKIHELKGEYELALENYEQQLQLEPNNFNIHIRLGRCHRNLKEYGKAESRIMETLSIHPFWPKANYELALVYAESGNTEKAIKYLEIAQEIWEEADPDFKPAALASEKLAEVQASK